MKKDGVITDRHRVGGSSLRCKTKKRGRRKKQLPKADAKWPTCLIIAPSTVVHNWEREFETWGYFEVGLYTGSPKDREPVINDFKLGRLDVVITSFDLARRDIDTLDDLHWSLIIVDEVHRVKNTSSQITQAYHQFSCLRRFGLTGTAIQNSYKELWTILDWTNPGRLGTGRQWNGYVAKPLTRGQSAGASEEERAKALVVAKVLRNKLLPNFFLRRTKDIIKDQLPQKTDQVVFCPLTDRQVSAYKNILNMEAMQNLLKRDEKCTCGSGKPRKACCHPFVVGDVFRYMSILIKLSNHLGLILPGPNDTTDQTVRNRQLAEIAFPDGNIPKFGTAMMQPQNCGKWATLEVLLKEWRKDRTNKVLIFTKSVKLLEMLEFHLNTRNYGFLKLDGSTKQAERMPMIDKFNHDPNVYIFLISTLAGGTGLNLTGANKVVIFDPNWNPAHDLQAMDRAFRFGQTRDVAVYRLLGAGSVEELIYARQIYKQQQMAIGYEASVQTRYFEGVQGDTGKQGELFGINNIFKLHEDKLATKMAIEKANLAELDWALANMGAGAHKGKKSAKSANELVEADAKFGKDDIVGNMKGLGALLFDDTPPTAPREQDVIKHTLSAIGVTYSHQNDEILVPSKIEAERVQTLLKVRRRKSKGAEKETEVSPKEQWPPRRRHHQYKASPTPEQQLHSRHKALVQLGMINGPEDIPTFARDFARQSPEDRRKILAELDDWAVSNQESDSSD
ncbi:P-loop containing nucleoside triphosphate hydrolase protein [Gymnopilus junonius]|uniref:P-loop containing nucleoside triphosphate hydrolase protein n=1 Tax=Gymnopilus junonius TaxID=109634 RepID=A0A9P5NTL9_GYMJU|nr:P-loop containing nucleoside triphosphate hydrolase protein [Gymnopilus junonius]